MFDTETIPREALVVTNESFIVAKLLLVVRPGATESFLFLEVPGATGSF